MDLVLEYSVCIPISCEAQSPITYIWSRRNCEHHHVYYHHPEPTRLANDASRQIHSTQADVARSIPKLLLFDSTALTTLGSNRADQMPSLWYGAPRLCRIRRL